MPVPEQYYTFYKEATLPAQKSNIDAKQSRNSFLRSRHNYGSVFIFDDNYCS
jgi:hypothetical protein